MTRLVSDSEVEEAFTAWARDSLTATAAHSVSVTRLESQKALVRRRSRRALPALAAAAVLVLVAVTLAVRYIGNENATPTTSAPECPRQPPAEPPLGTGPLPSDGQPLFARPVVEMTACSYTNPPRSRLVADVPLSRKLAAKLADDLNHAALARNDPEDCLTIPVISVLLARDTSGRLLAPITFIPGCDQTAASNGSTTRYLRVSDRAFRQANKYVYSHK